MPAANEPCDRPLIHEVIPTTDRETWHVHAIEVQRTILLPPVVVVVRVAEPLGHEGSIIARVAAYVVHTLEQFRSGGAADALDFLLHTEADCDKVYECDMI